MAEITAAQYAAMSAFIDALAAGQYLNREQITTLLNTSGAGFSGFPKWQNAEITAGVANLTVRSGQITRYQIDTEAGAATDTLTDITGDFADGDILVIRPRYNARLWVANETGNIRMSGGSFAPENNESFLILTYNGTNWYKFASYPERKDEVIEQDTVYIADDGLGNFFARVTAKRLNLTYLGAETLAVGDITFTATGGEVIVRILETDAPIELGRATNSGTTTDAANALETAIDALTGIHGYTANNTGHILHVTAPTGSGATANGYTLSVEVSGTMAASVTTAMSGGVNGAEAATDLNYLEGGSINEEIILYNAMTASDITILLGGAAPGEFNFTQVLAPGEFLKVIKDNDEVWKKYA